MTLRAIGLSEKFYIIQGNAPGILRLSEDFKIVNL